MRLVCSWTNLGGPSRVAPFFFSYLNNTSESLMFPGRVVIMRSVHFWIAVRCRRDSAKYRELHFSGASSLSSDIEESMLLARMGRLRSKRPLLRHILNCGLPQGFPMSAIGQLCLVGAGRATKAVQHILCIVHRRGWGRATDSSGRCLAC